jgi:putative transcriptional regulator
MSEHIDAWIPELVLGTLDPPTRSTVESHLADCARCAAEVVAMGEALSGLAVALPPERPQPAARAELLTALAPEAQPPARLASVAERVARFFDLTSERARALLALIDLPAAWTRGPADGVNLIDFEAGARYAGVDAGFVRLAPGATFPHHRHVGGELVLVVEGFFIEDSGTVVRAGEGQDLAAGTSHSFAAPPEAGCILAVLIWDGLDFAAAPPAPRDG